MTHVGHKVYELAWLLGFPVGTAIYAGYQAYLRWRVHEYGQDEM
jgi:hypothetical protein